jgi:DNA-binding CsgD family transcriptional regulator
VSELEQALNRLGEGDVTGALEKVGVEAFLVDREGVIRWQNAASRRAGGDVVGRRAVDSVVPREREDARRDLERLLESGMPADVSLQVFHAQGDVRLREFSIAPVQGAGTIVAIFALAARPTAVSGVAAAVETPLTSRQLEILQLLSAGLSTDAIAKELGLSRVTIRNHIASALSRLDAHSRIEAVAIARRLGWIRTR